MNSKSVTMRFCMDPTNGTQPPSTSSYFAPMVADRLHVRAEEIMGSNSIGNIWLQFWLEKWLDSATFHGQGSTKRWTLGCVNPASWLPLAVGRVHAT